MIEIYCDGSCRGNGKDTNIGGFGVCVLVQDQIRKSGYRIESYKTHKEFDTTNNRMEMEALIYAIDLAKNQYKNKECIIYCDSAYCVNMCRDWIWIWASNGWKNGKKQTVENIDLVYKLYEQLRTTLFPNYKIVKVKGHNNILGNELADALAKDDKAKIDKIFKENEEYIVTEDFFDFS